jgi:hypothetical protein
MGLKEKWHVTLKSVLGNVGVVYINTTGSVKVLEALVESGGNLHQKWQF